VVASEALRRFNLGLLELARENSDATFEFLGEAVNAKDPQAVAELWINHAPVKAGFGVGRLRKLLISANAFPLKVRARFHRTSARR
jgi:hypothetical protein